jgi:biopolymer transport protein ExbD
MAELAPGGGGGHKDGKKRTKKLSTRVDLTPMVDLGFLLITFFMLATTLIKPQTMEISMPSNKKVDQKDQSEVKASKAITIVMAKNNKIFYYFGIREKGVDPKVVEADYSKTGIRKMLLDRNSIVVADIKELKAQKEKLRMSDEAYKAKAKELRGNKEAPSVMIKATDEANYKNLVDMLDEMQICNISKYAIMDISQTDKDLIKPLDK